MKNRNSTQTEAASLSRARKQPAHGHRFGNHFVALAKQLDGYRAIAVIDSTGKARIWSHNPIATWTEVRDCEGRN